MSDATSSDGRRQAFELALLVESVADYAIFLLDPDGTVRTWNLGAEKIKGYAAAEIIGRHFSTFYTDADRARDHPRQELEDALRDGRFEEEGWRVRKDGSTFWANVVITPVRSPDGTLIGFGKVTRDLSARRLEEQRLLASAETLRVANEQLAQFRSLVLGVPDYAIFMLDPGGHITTWNTGAERIKGYRAEEVLGRHFELFYTDADRARRHPAAELEIAARDGHYDEEGWRVRKDGTQLWTRVSITAVRGDDGALAGFAKVTRDLSERRTAEEGLRATQRELERSNAELERFAVVAAHDLREPLTTIHSYVQLLAEAEGWRLSPGGRGSLAKVTDAVMGMQHLIEDLLLYARLGTAGVELGPVPLAPVVDRVLDRLNAAIAAGDAQIDVDVPAEAVVRVDRLGADIVLQNLVANAIKFGAPGGTRVAIAATAEADGWTLSVRDDGAGIAAADQERIFGAFERVRGGSRAAGQGLGLSICQRVAERSGGRIGVESQPGSGSRFWCWLPGSPDG